MLDFDCAQGGVSGEKELMAFKLSFFLQPAQDVRRSGAHGFNDKQSVS